MEKACCSDLELVTKRTVPHVGIHCICYECGSEWVE